MGAWLATALASARAAGPSRQMRRVAHSPKAASSGSRKENNEIDAIDEILEQIGQRMGTRKATIGTAKAWLQEQGPEGHQLAYRVGRLTRMRNNKCLAVYILQEVKAICSLYSGKEEQVTVRPRMAGAAYETNATNTTEGSGIDMLKQIM